jgi:very-short-patch-repair endonuclease
MGGIVMKKEKDMMPNGLLRKDYFLTLNDLKEYYIKHEAKIIALAKERPTQWYNSYIIDYHKIFSHIERDAWNSIRTKGKIVLYPQYPVANYFVDFGNPYLKIALELDGEEFHTDFEKDDNRDRTLCSMGWTTYRISGKKMMRTNYPEALNITTDNRREYEYWLFETGDGLIEAIKQIHFLNNDSDGDYDDNTAWFLAACEGTLLHHKSTGRWLAYAQ